MALSDYQMSYDGFVFGADTDIGISEIVGFDGLDVGVGDSAIPRGDGDVTGLARAKSRSVVLHLQANGERRTEELGDTLTEAIHAFSISDTPKPLHIKDPGFPEVFVYARPTGRILQRKPSLTFDYRPFSIRLKVADPRVYGAEQFTKTLGVYDASGGGLDYDIDDYGKDFFFDGSASAVVTNDGNANAYPVIVFFGPTLGTMTGATLTNLTNGAVADFDFTSPLLTGGTFTADMRRIVTIDPDGAHYIDQSGTNRYGDWQLPRDPFTISPGDNELRFEVDGTTTDAIASVSWRDTSL